MYCTSREDEYFSATWTYIPTQVQNSCRRSTTLLISDSVEQSNSTEVEFDTSPSARRVCSPPANNFQLGPRRGLALVQFALSCFSSLIRFSFTGLSTERCEWEDAEQEVTAAVAAAAAAVEEFFAPAQGLGGLPRTWTTTNPVEYVRRSFGGAQLWHMVTRSLVQMLETRQRARHYRNPLLSRTLPKHLETGSHLYESRDNSILVDRSMISRGTTVDRTGRAPDRSTLSREPPAGR